MTMRASIVLGPMADKDLPESFFNLLKRERVRETQAAPGHHLNSPLENFPAVDAGVGSFRFR